jgi:hypothetical protein
VESKISRKLKKWRQLLLLLPRRDRNINLVRGYGFPTRPRLGWWAPLSTTTIRLVNWKSEQIRK